VVVETGLVGWFRLSGSFARAGTSPAANVIKELSTISVAAISVLGDSGCRLILWGWI